MNFPGVGAYDPNDVFVKKKPINYSFSKSQRFHLSNVLLTRIMALQIMLELLVQDLITPKCLKKQQADFNLVKLQEILG